MAPSAKKIKALTDKLAGGSIGGGSFAGKGINRASMDGAVKGAIDEAKRKGIFSVKAPAKLSMIEKKEKIPGATKGAKKPSSSERKFATMDKAQLKAELAKYELEYKTALAEVEQKQAANEPYSVLMSASSRRDVAGTMVQRVQRALKELG